jgi:hypothetical protein
MTDVAQTEEAHRGAICISVGVFFSRDVSPTTPVVET